MKRQKTRVELLKEELARAQALEAYGGFFEFQLSKNPIKENSSAYNHFRDYLNQQGLELSGDSIRPLGTSPEEGRGQGYLGANYVIVMRGTLLEKLSRRYNPPNFNPKHGQCDEINAAYEHGKPAQHSSAAGH